MALRMNFRRETSGLGGMISELVLSSIIFPTVNKLDNLYLKRGSRCATPSALVSMTILV